MSLLHQYLANLGHTAATYYPARQTRGSPRPSSPPCARPRPRRHQADTSAHGSRDVRERQRRRRPARAPAVATAVLCFNDQMPWASWPGCCSWACGSRADSVTGWGGTKRLLHHARAHTLAVRWPTSAPPPWPTALAAERRPRGRPGPVTLERPAGRATPGPRLSLSTWADLGGASRLHQARQQRRHKAAGCW